jgi:hypothetical protein
MSVFTSPYNSPQAQHQRLRRVADEYRGHAETLKTAGLCLWCIGAVFVLMGWAISALASFFGLCMIGAAFGAYHLLSTHYDSPSSPPSWLVKLATTYRDTAQTLKSASLWLGGIGAALVLMGSGRSSFLGLCIIGVAFAAYYPRSDHDDSPSEPPSFKCPYCSHQMPLFQRWKCGYCPRWNEARTRTIVEECPCGIEPHSLMCTACGELIIFDEYKYNRSPGEYAYFAGAQPRATRPAEDKLAERRRRLRL